MTEKNMLRYCIAVTISLALGRLTAGCMTPTGIDFGDGCDTGNPDDCVPVGAFRDLPDNSILGSAIGAVNGPQPGLSGIETPVVNQWVASNIGQVYSAMSAFDPVALELWGRRGVSENRRRCGENDGVPIGQFRVHRRVTLAYTVLYVLSTVEIWVDPPGGAEVPLRELADEWGIDFDLCDLDRERANDNVASCEDSSTPWGFALLLVDEILDWLSRDGWNRNGDLFGAVNNLIPYRDGRSERNRYTPMNEPWEFTERRRWQPLLEHNSNGFLFYQEHVTPHIGETAKTIFIPDEEICSLSANRIDGPEYNLTLESDLALERSAGLNDRLKARIELFDNKLLSLSPLVGQYYSRRGVPSDDLEFIVAQVANLHAIREATILVWRSKVQYDLVRPNTYIRNIRATRNVRSYGGPDVGRTITLRASDWQPYIRVMPHSEYPSGSACLCQAFADALTFLTGSNELNDPPFLSLTRPEGSSGVEEDRPRNDQTFNYTSWAQVALECGQSRLDGGMHYTASVPDGYRLCRGLGEDVARAIKALSEGEDPAFVTDFNFDKSDITEIRPCPSEAA